MKGFRTWRVEIATDNGSLPNAIHFARRKDAQSYAKTIKEHNPNADVSILTLEPMYMDYQELIVVGSDEWKEARIGGYRKKQG